MLKLRAGVVACLLALAAGVLGALAYGQASARVSAAAEQDRRLEVLLGGGGRIGATVRDVDKPDVDRQKLPSQTGAVIDEVTADSAAAKAGLRSGDIVVEFDGERVRSAAQFSRIVRETASGRTVAATIVRDGQRTNVQVSPEDDRGWFGERGTAFALPRFEMRSPRFEMYAPELRLMPEGFRGEFEWTGAGRLGVSVQDLTPELAEYFGAQDGVLVSQVQKESAAAKAGVRAGDVITTVNGTAVDSPSDLRREVTRADGDITLGIVRDKQRTTVKATIERSPRAARPRVRAIV